MKIKVFPTDDTLLRCLCCGAKEAPTLANPVRFRPGCKKIYYYNNELQTYLQQLLDIIHIDQEHVTVDNPSHMVPVVVS